MSTFTRSYTVWSNARQDADLAPHQRYSAGRKNDMDIASAVAQVTPLLLNGEAHRSPALVTILQQADSDELAALCAWPGVGDILTSVGIGQEA